MARRRDINDIDENEDGQIVAYSGAVISQRESTRGGVPTSSQEVPALLECIPGYYIQRGAELGLVAQPLL